jgi:hypothetical protein
MKTSARSPGIPIGADAHTMLRRISLRWQIRMNPFHGNPALHDIQKNLYNHVSMDDIALYCPENEHARIAPKIRVTRGEPEASYWNSIENHFH